MPDDREEAINRLAKRLVEETGIAEAEARDLIRMLGRSWPSLVREARIIAKISGF